ncbi:MAG: thiamine pyrophosphate-binding protein [Mycobacterium leprae]
MATSSKTGRFAVIEQFLADGVTHMFGNPGTTEQGLLDALGAYPDLRYVFALQEAVAIGIADGYGRATKKPTLVQLHSAVGLGNGIGMIYEAMRGHSPLVVIAGDCGLRYDAMDAQMAGDLVAMAKPVTKWATRVVDPSSTLRVLRRAAKIAATPPMGPVFVSLPMDVLDAESDEEIRPTSFPRTRVLPEGADIQRAAEVLAEATRPIIIVGDGVAVAGAQPELTRVAELTGAAVWGADWAEVSMDYGHPQFQGVLGHMFGEVNRAITSQADAVLICGTYAFPEVFPSLSGVFAPGTPVVHIDLDAYEIAKNFPVDLGIVADPKPTLGLLADALTSRMTPEQRAAAAARGKQLGERTQRDRAEQRERDRAASSPAPLRMAQFAEELARQLPDDAIVFDESLSVSPDLVRYLLPHCPGHYFQSRGHSLGVGIPGAIGVKLANPDNVVVGLTGDGGSMYTFQALWTAAHHDVDATFVICNNSAYQTLKNNLQEYWDEQQIPAHAFPSSFDLTGPDIRFDDLARSLGVAAARVEKADEIEPAIRQALAHRGPFLIDLVLTNQPT